MDISGKHASIKHVDPKRGVSIICKHTIDHSKWVERKKKKKKIEGKTKPFSLWRTFCGAGGRGGGIIRIFSIDLFGLSELNALAL